MIQFGLMAAIKAAISSLVKSLQIVSKQENGIFIPSIFIIKRKADHIKLCLFIPSLNRCLIKQP